MPAEKKSKGQGAEEFLQDGRGTYVIPFCSDGALPGDRAMLLPGGTFSIPTPLQRAGGLGGRYLQQGKDKAKA